MNDNFAKYILVFLALTYFLGCAGEAIFVKNGAEAVFESTKTFVPHMMTFILGFYFSRR